ncbi:MAG: hypothetical protein MUC67_08450 [Acidobacteria bacterium]|nr:hypothetical protein [Acidobacteriota bacterium]
MSVLLSSARAAGLGAAILLAAGPIGQAATDPGTRGPLAVGKLNVDIPVTGGATLGADVYYPAKDGGVDPAAGSLPVVIFGHGFSRNKDRYDLGEHLATRGYLTIQANYPCGFFGCDHSKNADDMSAQIDWILARDADPASIFFGRIDRTRIGTSGHSAGGLWALTAAGRDARIIASAPLDPVDNNGLGAGALPSARAAIGITFSEPSSCNANGSAEVLYGAAVPQKRGVRLVGANHCDPEKSNDFLGCALTCGSWNATRHQRYLRYVTGWLEYFLRCDKSYEEWALGARVEQDVASGVAVYDAALDPDAPLGLAADASGAAIAVTRAAPDPCAAIDSWRLFRATASGGPFTLRAGDLPPGQTAFRDEAVDAGRTYYYVARDTARDFRESYESPDSTEASATAGSAGPGPGEASPPNAPLFARRGPGASTAIDLTYAPAPCAAGHTIYWSTRAGPLAGPPAWSAQACGFDSSGAAAFDPGPLAAGSWLYFVVVGHDGAREGSYGRDAGGAERPPAGVLPVCSFEQDLAPCPSR